MSGWYPHVRGHRTIYHMMQPDEPVLLRTLKQNGYYVWWGGKNDLISADADFNEYCSEMYEPKIKPKKESNLHFADSWRGEPGDRNYFSFYGGKLDPLHGDETFYDKDWADVYGAIDRIKNAPDDQPLCIYLPILYPHPPYGVEDPWYSMIDRGKIPRRVQHPEDWKGKPSMLKGIHERQNMQSWTEEEWTELKATYYGMCARVDHQFGMVMDALKEAGIYDDTAVFFFSDHGDYTGDYSIVEKNQNTFEDPNTNVPLIVKPPKSYSVKPGINKNLVELIDVPATIEEMVGITPNHTHFGKSLVPMLEDHEIVQRDAVFCEGGRLHGETHCMEANAVSHAAKPGLYWPRISLQAEEGPEHTKAVMCRTKDFKYVRRLYEQDELYDLRNDPNEVTNRINDPALADVLMTLKERVLNFYMETSDVVPHELDKRF
jgi:arylsulfatase A-like enzyme